MILGIGIDIVKVERIKAAYKRLKYSFLKKVFTQKEIEYAFSKKDPFIHLSARFAAKEAFLKALGTGWSQGIKWTDIEVIESQNGAPKITFSGVLSEKAKKKGVKNALLSLSHDKMDAVAVVVLTGENHVSD